MKILPLTLKKTPLVTYSPLPNCGSKDVCYSRSLRLFLRQTLEQFWITDRLQCVVFTVFTKSRDA